MLGSTRREGGGMYLNIFQGNIVQEFKEKPDTPGDYHERTNKNGAKRYYLKYDFLSGYLVGAHRETTDFGEQISLYFRDGESRYTLRMQADSKYARSFYYKMDAIDLSKPVTLSPYDFIGDDQKRLVGMTIKQDDEKVAYGIPQDEVPEVEVKTRAGKTTYDDTDRYNFFIERFDAFAKGLKPIADEEPVPFDGDEEEGDDDLPF